MPSEAEFEAESRDLIWTEGAFSYATAKTFFFFFAKRALARVFVCYSSDLYQLSLTLVIDKQLYRLHARKKICIITCRYLSVDNIRSLSI